MRTSLHVKCIYVLAIILIINCSTVKSQCSAGYSLDTLKWDHLDFLPNTGRYISPTAYINLAKSQTQYFSFGAQRVRVTHNYSGTNDPGDDDTHTGSAGSYGTGFDVHFLGNGTITYTFDAPVLAAKFSIYDIDRNQSVSVTAFDGVTPVSVTMAKVSGSILTITGSPGFSPLATAINSNASNSSTDGTINIDISAAITGITITVTNTGTNGSEDGSLWLSDLIACSPGSLPNNYYAVSKPFINQPAYFLVSLNNSVYYVDVATGNAKFLFADPGATNINSMGYDPYGHMVYYTYSLTATPASNKILRRYDYEQDTLGIVSTNVNNLGVPTYEAGIESGAAAFYNGSLYLGIEGYAGSGANSNRESAVWKMDFNASYAPTGNYEQVFAVPGDNGSGTLLHDWSDFGISDGVLYDFDGASSAGNSDFYHKNLLTGGTVNYVPSPSGLVPRQVGVDWTGQMYNVGSASGIAPGTIVPYNYDGTVNNAQLDTIKYNGVAVTGSWGDAAEAFKPKTDFGDAPASYDPGPGDPAAHEIIANLRLGAAVDIEFAKKTSATASLDNFDDGMTSLLIIPTGVVNYLRPVDVFNNTGADATVIGWLDANGDGVFQSSEGRSVTVGSSASPQTVNLFWAFINVTPAVGTTIFMRIRVTSSVYGMTTSTPNGFYENGEVEDYAIIISNVLPNENVGLKAKKIDNKTALINWKPADETTFAGYELERSADGTNWHKIYATNINALNNFEYKYYDTDPLRSISYYRLKIYKYSGEYLYTDIKQLEFSGNVSISVNPNPAGSTVNLVVQTELAGQASFSLIDYSGRKVYQENAAVKPGKNEILLPGALRLSSGLYKVIVMINNEVLTATLVVIN